MRRRRHDSPATLGAISLLVGALLLFGCASTGPKARPSAGGVTPPKVSTPKVESEGDPGTPATQSAVIGQATGRLNVAKKKQLSFHCGTERWPVKTLSDQDIQSVDFTNVVKTTIANLNNVASECGGKLPDDQRARPEERQVFEVVGLVEVIKQENDRDYHIALQDPDSGDTMVVEILDTRCPGARDAPTTQQEALRNARQNLFDALGDAGLDALNGLQVRVQGVGFFDRAHGQTGLSKSCMELHPLLSFELLP
jgi:hypothetical protein